MKMARLVFCCCLLLAILLPGAALAQDEPESIPEKITITSDFPSIESIAGGTFEFTVEIAYVGEEAKIFDLRATVPKGWDVYITPKYEKEKKISSINLKPTMGGAAGIRVVASAPFWPLPDPGEYKITIEAISETIETSVELTAEITAKYILSTVSETERYNTTARAGEDNFFPIHVGNLGTDAINDIKFTPNKPEGWVVEFDPEKIEILEAFGEQVVKVNIKPPAKTVAGDYVISLRASGQQTSANEMSIRVTVETPTIWGWVGVAIILIVVIGLVVIFMRFSRR